MTFMALREIAPKYLTELFSTCQNDLYGLRRIIENYIYQNIKQFSKEEFLLSRCTSME